MVELTKTNKTFIICLIFIFGVSAFYMDLTIYYSLFLLILGLLTYYKKFISIRFLILSLLILAISTTYSNLRVPQVDKLAEITPIKADLKGIITSQVEKKPHGKSRFELDVYSYSKGEDKWTPVKAKTLVTAYRNSNDSNNYMIGDKIELRGKVTVPAKVTNWGQFDYKKYLENQRIFSITYTSGNTIKLIQHPESGKWLYIQKLNKFRDKIIEKHGKYLKSPNLEILGGIVFGNHAIPAPKEVKEDFLKSGLLHLLAASGMNVGLIFGLWALFSKGLKLPFMLSTITGMILILIYSVLTGLPPSVCRATIVFELVLFARLIERQADFLALLALAAAFMLIFDPLLITNISFQLSFIVAFGLILYTETLTEKMKPLPANASTFITVPITAMLWVIPIQLYHFNNVAVYSVFANFAVTPFIFFITNLGFVSSILCLIPKIGEPICQVADYTANFFLTILLKISEYFSSLPGALQYLAAPTIIEVTIFYALLIALIIHIKNSFKFKKLNYLILILLLALIIIPFRNSFDSSLKFVFLEVGEGDSAYVKLPDNKHLIVDTGNISSRGYSRADFMIIPFLRDLGVGTLDSVILTHPDKDHIGGTVDLLKSIKTREIIDNGESSNTRIYRKTYDYLHKNKIKIRHIAKSETIYTSENLNIQIIRPPNIDKSSNNEDSLVTYIKYKNFSALLMGDCESDSLEYLKSAVKPPVNIIKIGHHGSYKSVSDDLLKYLRPQYAIISVGKNDYGHPNAKTLKFLNMYGIKTLRTDIDNAINVTTDGKKVYIKTFS